MTKETQVGIGSQGKKLHPSEIATRAHGLMDEFVKILQPRLDNRTNWEIIRTQNERDIAIMGGNGVPPIDVFGKGFRKFRVINYCVNNPEGRTLAISMGSELAALIDDGPSGNNGAIEYHVRGRFEAVNNVNAVKGAERMLRKLKYPLLPQLLPIRLKKAA